MLEDFEESAMLKERFAEQRKPVLVSGRIGETIGSLHVETPPSWKIILDSGCGPAIGLQPDCGHPLYPLRCVAPAPQRRGLRARGAEFLPAKLSCRRM
jgi:hypothetical protein